MRVTLPFAAMALALPVVACGPAPAPRATLDCPANRGDLTRTAISPDGKSCAYTSSDGAEVTLQLVSAPGGVDQALSGIETNLLAGRHKPEAPKSSDPADQTAADKAAREAEVDAKGGVTASIDEHGVKVHARANGKDVDAANVEVRNGKVEVGESKDGATHVNLPGIHVDADDTNDTAHVQVGPININAGDGSATVRVKRDVRLRGEALSPTKRGFRATMVYHGDDLPDGYKFVGYEAGGRKTGPFAVAIVKSKEKDADGGRINSDVTKLVRMNGGV